MPIRCPSLRDITRRLGACPKGNTAIEFGLTAPLLVLLAFGAFDYGSAYVEGVRLNGAARAGAQQALYNSQTGRIPTRWSRSPWRSTPAMC